MAYRLLCRVLVLLVVVSWPMEAYAWGKGHRLIRLWAVAFGPSNPIDAAGSFSLARVVTPT